MDIKQAQTLCFLGCGNLGTAILSGLLDTVEPLFSHFIVTVRTDASANKLREQFAQHKHVSITTGRNADAVKTADVVILATDPTDVESVLTAPHMRDNLRGKLVISVAAGWTRQRLEALLDTQLNDTRSDDTTVDSQTNTWVIRTLPNVAAVVHHSLTVIETPHPDVPPEYLRLATAIFDRVGKTMVLPPYILDAATAVGGSTPAFFAVICEALIDAAVAVGVPRGVAHESIAQSMLGTARMLQTMQPGEVKDKGTSPEGCTMSGLMVLEEGAVRGHVGRALREAVSVSRKMGRGLHLNDTR